MKKIIVLLPFIMILSFALIGCDSGKGSPSDNPVSSSSSEIESETGDKNKTETETKTDTESIKWLSYDLVLDELREMNDSDNFSVIDPPDGNRYVVARLLSADGEIPAEKIVEENVKPLKLKDSNGTEYDSVLVSFWGVEFNDETGFSTKEMQEGFWLLYIIPENISLQDLTLIAK